MFALHLLGFVIATLAGAVAVLVLIGALKLPTERTAVDDAKMTVAAVGVGIGAGLLFELVGLAASPTGTLPATLAMLAGLCGLYALYFVSRLVLGSLLLVLHRALARIVGWREGDYDVFALWASVLGISCAGTSVVWVTVLHATIRTVLLMSLASLIVGFMAVCWLGEIAD